MMNTEGFIPDDVPRMGRLVKALAGALDDADRMLLTNELRKMYRRNIAAIREHRKKNGAPGMSGKGHRIGDDEPKKGKKGERGRSSTPAPAASSGSSSQRRSRSRPAPFRGKAQRLD